MHKHRKLAKAPLSSLNFVEILIVAKVILLQNVTLVSTAQNILFGCHQVASCQSRKLPFLMQPVIRTSHLNDIELSGHRSFFLKLKTKKSVPYLKKCKKLNECINKISLDTATVIHCSRMPRSANDLDRINNSLLFYFV